jgi:hypothetical protein
LFLLQVVSQFVARWMFADIKTKNSISLSEPRSSYMNGLVAAKHADAHFTSASGTWLATDAGYLATFGQYYKALR